MLIKHKVRSFIVILFLATIMFLPTSAFAALFDEVEQIGDTGNNFSITYFQEQNLLPARVSVTKNSKVRQSIMLAAKKGANKFSIGTQPSS